MGRPKTYDREQVLERATTLFWDKGYEGTHLRELVEVTGISRFSLYQEFGGKEGLFREALATYVETLSELAAVLGREPAGLANLRDFYRALVDFGFRNGCFVLDTIREKHVVPDSAFAIVRRFVEGMEESFRRNVRAARDAGELPRDLDVEAHARLLASLNMGLLTYAIVDPDPARLEAMVGELDRLWA